MKKLLVIFLVLAFVAPAMAADNLDVSGQVRIRSWDTENFGDFDDDNAADKGEYFEQRFRLQATIKANDQVKAVTRVDFAEDEWGSSDWSTHRYNENSELQVDRAYLDITTGPVNIKAGQQFYAVGQSQVIRNNKPGIQITIKTPVVIELGYSVEQDQDQGATDDEANMHLSLTYAADAFSVEGFYGQQVTNAGAAGADDTEDTRTVFGVNGKFGIGPVKINTELALFGGDNDQAGAAAVDYVGTQFNVDADMKLSDMIQIGADLIYSDGTDSADEEKIAYIGDVFGRLNRSEGGSGNNIYAGDLAPLGADDVFDPFNGNQGSIGLGVDVIITPMAGLDILAHVMYLTSAEDTAGETGYDNALLYNLGVTYAIAPKAKFGLYYTAVDPEAEDSDVDADTASNIGGLLQIAF
jgi:hypothetical protein